jgi:alpha-1,2-mannosyltransferase
VPDATPRRLRRWEKSLIVLFFAGWAAFGVLVEIKSAFLSRRYGDLGVYLRAGWAVRAGVSPYEITDNNGWHYHYPPLFAILVAPLADPPPGVAIPGAVHYRVSVAICYILNLLCLAVGVHVLASALEAASRHPGVRAQSPGCRSWWLLRTVPVFACLPPIGHTLMRGQVNLLLVALVCLAAAAALRGRRLWSGAWLAGAASLKLFPAYLFLFPLWRRDLRGLAGCALGLVVCLFVLPTAFLGPGRTVELYRQQFDVLVRPGLGLGGDSARDKELIETTATDSQSFLTVLHNSIYPDRTRRPNVASAGVRRAHWLLGAAFTALTLAAARRPLAGPKVPLFLGALSLVMILTSPVSHTHYFAMLLPVAMGLLAWDWEEGDGTTRLRPWLIALFALQVVGQVLPLLPFRWAEVLKDGGLAACTGLTLWLAACWVLGKQVRPATAGESGGLATAA